MHVAKDADIDEAVFLKDRSVFARFKDNTEKDLEKAFE